MIDYISNAKTPENDIRERCSVKELLNRTEIPDISVAKCRVQPGITTELHALKDARELYVIISGQGAMDDGTAAAQNVGPDDIVMVSPNHPQRIKNTGEDDLIFLAICTARFEPHRYITLEGDGGAF